MVSRDEFHAMYQAQCQAEYEAWAEEEMEKVVTEHLHGETPGMKALAEKAVQELKRADEFLAETESGRLQRWRFEAALTVLTTRLPRWSGPGGYSIPIGEMVKQAVQAADLLMGELGLPQPGENDGQQDPG